MEIDLYFITYQTMYRHISCAPLEGPISRRKLLVIGLSKVCMALDTLFLDRLCGLVVRGLGYRSRGPGLIPGNTRFSEK
jgi:hypothetical protein